MHPDWLGSPQHFVAGALGVTAFTEIAVELVEYPLMYAGKFHYSAYYDTLADLADTMAGAVVGAAIGLVGAKR